MFAFENLSNKIKLMDMKYDTKFNVCCFNIKEYLPIDDWKISLILKFMYSHSKIRIIKLSL